MRRTTRISGFGVERLGFRSYRVGQARFEATACN